MFSPDEATACRRLIHWALEEDLGAGGDLTSQTVIPEGLQGRAVFVARAEGVLAGLDAAALVVEAVGARLRLAPLVTDGARLKPGERIAVISGPMRGLLAAERTALNFLQHLSGIASLTRRYVDAVAGFSCRILDTRKTIPGWRLLAKYAVRQGGGDNHRMGLFDGILVKDNHLASLGPDGLAALKDKLTAAPRGKDRPFIEIEVDRVEQLPAAFACSPDMVLFDNMTLDELRAAVTLRNQQAPTVLVEASGGVNLNTVRTIAETGVDRISVGAITHSAPALDIALDFEAP